MEMGRPVSTSFKYCLVKQLLQKIKTDAVTTKNLIFFVTASVFLFLLLRVSLSNIWNWCSLASPSPSVPHVFFLTFRFWSNNYIDNTGITGSILYRLLFSKKISCFETFLMISLFCFLSNYYIDNTWKTGGILYRLFCF